MSTNLQGKIDTAEGGSHIRLMRRHRKSVRSLTKAQQRGAPELQYYLVSVVDNVRVNAIVVLSRTGPCISEPKRRSKLAPLLVAINVSHSAERH